MEIKLAGFNIDIENVVKLKSLLSKYPEINPEDIESLKKIEWTPETISASYARISRDPRPINELRAEASSEIKKARRSNQAIIFEMGHSSIAEHAVFNFDITGLTRLAAEYLEKSRLVSFTEKSQRYIKIGNDNLIPEEFKKDKDFFKDYKSLLEELFASYEYIHGRLVPYFKSLYPDIDEKSGDYRDIINLAKEDARYILPLSTLTQVGMTVNARSLEKIIRKLLSLPLIELNQLAHSLFNAVEGYAPSLVKYTEPNDFEKKDYGFIKDLIKKEKHPEKNNVELIKIDRDIEDKILAGFIVKNSDLTFLKAYDAVKELSAKKKEDIFNELLKDINSYDAVQREFELSEIEFNINMSASCYAQMKRHRMATIIDGRYSPELGVTIPESIKVNNLSNYFLERTGKIDRVFEKARNKFGLSSDYILSNAHRKNIVLKCNLRELVHISRLRLDMHAQWDIRNISAEMIGLVKPYLKFAANLLCGKDNFNKKFKKM